MSFDPIRCAGCRRVLITDAERRIGCCRACVGASPDELTSNNGPGADTPGPVQAAEEGDRP